MKLEHGRNFKQFFFVTVGVAGRCELLSRLVDEKTRPARLLVGEVVAAALRALHLVNAAVTLSDYVIMPDHFHFIMIVDYSRDKTVSPLYMTHRVLDAIEMWLERTGALPPHPRDTGEKGEPAVHGERCGLAAQGEKGGRAAPTPGEMARLIVEAMAIRGAEAEPPCVPLFERSPYIELSFDSRQLKAIRRYIKLNPARTLWKKRNPDLFRCHRNIKAQRLAPFASTRFDGIGNLTLLGSPFLLHVRLTLKKPVAEHAAAIAEILEKARRGVVPVSGFISPGECELLRQLKAEPRARFIKMLPCALPPRYDPSAEDSREIAAGRLAILSAFPDTPAISSLEMRRDPSAAHVFRKNCLAMNDLAAKLCQIPDII